MSVLQAEDREGPAPEGHAALEAATPEPAWRGMFRDLPREHGFEPLRVEGVLPDDLHGTLYRCGPARFRIGGEPYLHWFDADGAVAAVRIGNGRAEGAVRTVATRWLGREQGANRQLYRSYAQLGRGWRRWLTLPKNPANISVLPYRSQVLALWEAGLPIALDASSLETVGETDLGGQIGPTFSAHPHRVGGTLFNFGVHYGPKFSLDLYSFAEKISRIASVPLPRPTIIHDFIATPGHLVFFCPPVRLRLARLLAGIGTFEENLAWEPEHGTEVLVVPLASPERPVRFEVPPFFQWHLVNAWDESDGSITVDFLPYEDFETNRWFGRAPFEPWQPAPRSKYARAHLDLRARRMDIDVLSEVSFEFPAIAPAYGGRRHDQTWLLDLTNGLPPALCRFDSRTQAHRTVPFGPDTVPSEAIVAGRWVLSLVYDGARDASFVAVIDARRPEDGPVAKLWFDHAIPFLFHGAWAP